MFIMKKVFILGLVGVFLGLSGCALTDRFKQAPTPGTSSTTTVSSTFFTSSTPQFAAAFDTDILTWQEYYVEDMGFSIKVPFEKKDVSLIFHDCTKPGDRCDGRTDTYWYGGNFGPLYLGSQSEFYSSGGETGFELYDFFIKDSRYFLGSRESVLVSDELQEIHPIIVYKVGGQDFAIIDIYKEIDRIKEENYGDGERIIPQSFAAVFKLPASKKFKAAYLLFYEKDLTMEQFKKVLNTIRFK